MKRRISVSGQVLDPAADLIELESLGGGAVASFTGLVRGGDGLSELWLEHYPAMTHAQIERIVADAERRWSLLGVVVRHRVGAMCPGERIVFVGTAARHRREALDACSFLIDWLKTDAPFWKKERFSDGREAWVETRIADMKARNRWDDNGKGR